MEDRSLQQGLGCVSGLLDTSKRVCFSSVLPHRQSSVEGQGRISDNFIDNASLANPSLVSSATLLIRSKPNSSSSGSEPVKKPSRRLSSSNGKPQSIVSCLDSFRGSLKAKGISEKASDLITAARRPGTISHYRSSWNKWSSWCDSRQIDPFRCSLKWIIGFLLDSFNEGLLYNIIAGYRSAISAYHDPIEGFSVGKHLLVSSILSGIHNKRFPQPKYIHLFGMWRK